VPIYRVESGPDKVPEVRAVACSVSGLVQLKREASLISTCNFRLAGGLETMQGCTVRIAHKGRDSGAICARALAGRTGELPADHRLASSGRGTAAGRSRGRLAQSLGASRQSVILLRRHYPLTILHYCYSNKPLGGVPLGSVPKIKSPGPASRFERQYGAGQAPMFRLTRSATRALPETRGDLHPSFCQDRPAVPQVRRAGFRGRHYRSRYGRPIRNAAVLLTGRYHPTASERRGTAPRSAADGSQEPVPCRNRLR